MSDRYTVLGSIAKGGMGVVYLARMAGSAGFSRLVAIKRLHREVAAERGLVAMLVDEARMASRIRHANVIDTLDLVIYDGAFSLVLEYVEGDSLSSLIKRARELGEDVPRPIALAIMHGVLRGLDAAHQARSDDGAPLGLVHRDVSPQNVLVGVDGVPRVIDFGVAKALGRLSVTRPGEVVGKYSYMAPEQLLSRPVTRQADVYAAGIILWELLAHTRLFTAESFPSIVNEVLKGDIPNPSETDPSVPSELDAITKKATSRDLGQRYFTAREFLDELKTFPRASDDDVGTWVRRLAAEVLAKRQSLVQENVPPTETHSLDDLIDDLKRSKGGSPARALEPPPLASSTAIELPSQLETLTSDPSALPLVSPGSEGASPTQTKRRRRIIASASVAPLALLAIVALGWRGAEPAEPSTVRTSSIASSSSAATTASETVVATPPVALAPSSSTLTPVATVSAPVRSDLAGVPVPVRSESPARRQKPAAPNPRYDPGNFR